MRFSIFDIFSIDTHKRHIFCVSNCSIRHMRKKIILDQMEVATRVEDRIKKKTAQTPETESDR